MCKPYINSFFSQAIDKRMYAFASDYLRFKILQEFGGIYLDLDMLLIKKIPESMINELFFIGLQDKINLGFGIIGSIPNHPVLKPIEKKHYAGEFNYFDPPVLPRILSKHILDFHHQNNSSIRILSPDIFYPLPLAFKKDSYDSYTTDRTIGIHLWDYSWKSIYEKQNILKLWFTLITDWLKGRYSFRFTTYHFFRLLKDGLRYRTKKLLRL